MAKFNRIDALVSNAGICTFHPFLTLPADLYLRTQNVNMNGAFWISQAVANQMKNQELIDGERGCIVGISSISAIMGGGEQCHYCPTKAGIKSLMESCAIALGPYGIRCNSIMPGERADLNISLQADTCDRHDCHADERGTSGEPSHSDRPRAKGPTGQTWSARRRGRRHHLHVLQVGAVRQRHGSAS